MASSVAQKRLFHEYKLLSQSPPDGITAGPISEDDMFLWEALIQGPEGTPFEGGVFAAELKFPKDYPLSPPTMKFVGGGVWHPNGMLCSTRHEYVLRRIGAPLQPTIAFSDPPPLVICLGFSLGRSLN